MTDSRFDRFRRLERPRTAGPEEAGPSSGTDARIEAVRGPEQDSAPATPADADAGATGHLDRFRPATEPELELDVVDHDSQAFFRCAACQTDNFRTAARCTGCGADLGSDQQRAFNQRFWAGRKAEAALEAEASAARRARRDEDLSRDTTQRREAAEALARQVGDAERLRLEREGFGGGWGGGAPTGWSGRAGPASVPVGVRWLRLLPPGWSIPAGVALVLAPVLLFLVAPPAGLVVGAVVLALFSPPRWRSRLGSRWDA